EEYLLCTCLPHRCGELLDTVHSSRARPASLDLFRWEELTRGPMNVLFASFEGKPETVEWQLQQLESELGAVEFETRRSQPTYDEDEMSSSTCLIPLSSGLVFEAAVPANSVAAFLG